MNRSLRRTFALALAGAATAMLAACGSGDAAGGSGDVLKVGTLTDAPPVVYLKDGRFTGFDNELLRAVADRQGIKLEFVGVEFSTLLSKVANNQVDIGSSQISATDKRRQTVDFTNGYEISYTSIVGKADTSISGIEGLAGKRVGVVQATVQDEYASGKIPGANVVRFPDYNSAFAQLRNGNLDVWIVPLDIADKYIKNTLDFPQKVVVQRADRESPAAWAVRKGNGALRDKLNTGLVSVIEDGTYAKLHQQHLPGSPLDDSFKPKTAK
ncbi:polar amino acid transport system substrate-binding protein [Herbihabitans rhizosphaerae]|uniref:Polar amino acid transport system substrate-binding protein n=1 Tax=Herbihabitans rhizosphaerae TaxID=1872711 RepID=A0A4Q7KYL0_9PSEU|nr:ABC transporter substrate-binding protein [Herbihabitans rhizosphaerae]RZS41390.1 polar amino acid transport system substrate-binding protein [Herbihabitans rhizosphaerae]